MGKSAKRTVRYGMSMFCAFTLLLAGYRAAGAETGTAVAKNDIDDYNTGSYQIYLQQNGALSFNNISVALTADDLAPCSTGTEKVDCYKGYPGKAVITQEKSNAVWQLDVDVAGYYSIALDYFAMEGSGEAVERSLSIDGHLPFAEARSILFTRVFADDGNAMPDSDGNESWPTQKEVLKWQNTYVHDVMGYQGDRLYFFLSKGPHTLGLVGIREPMVVGNITLSSQGDDVPSYQDYLASYRAKGGRDVSGISGNGLLIYEAEKSYEKSDQTLYPVNDRSSPATTPNSTSQVLLNSIGGTKWENYGQWLSWQIDAPQSGFYKIALRSRQNFVRGMYSTRCLYIDGEIPFKEAENLRFYYSDSWQLNHLGSEGQGYLFYLEKGQHILTLNVTLGNMAPIIAQVQQSVSTLNKAYWNLVTIMGLKPDLNRDYHVSTVMPEIIDTFKEQSSLLNDLADEFQQTTGQTDSYTVALVQLARQMARMANDDSLIASNLSSFSDNIGALADWISTSTQQPLQLDKVILSQPGTALPKAEKGFLSNMVYQAKMLFATFITDYNFMSSKSTVGYPTIKVWIGNGITGGRDQVQVLKRLVSNDFTLSNKINVNLQLVAAGTLIPATLAGKGPDVSLQTSGDDPANYAMRGAVYDLTKFSDYPDIAARFPQGALTQYTYLHGVYALPETMSFYMMFYRKDILSNLGIDPGQLKTWDDVIKIIPNLQDNHLTFGLPVDLNVYAMFLYQMKGTFYKEDGKKSNLDSKTAGDAFKFWAGFYNNYQLPIQYDMVNRFRTGAMPIAIDNYTNYNLLTISAPEIHGLWGMLPVPGVKEGNSINNTAPISGAGCVLMNRSNEKVASWDFMKWWTSADVQVEFGLELESVLGPAARYNTANTEAIKRLPWSASDENLLLDQLQNSKGIPEVAGGYFTTRYINFSIRDVTNGNLEPRTVLLSYVHNINDGILSKRKEFGLN